MKTGKRNNPPDRTREREKERDREMIYLPGVETLGKKRENDLYTVVGPCRSENIL
jgi:hypothetical protein